MGAMFPNLFSKSLALLLLTTTFWGGLTSARNTSRGDLVIWGASGIRRQKGVFPWRSQDFLCIIALPPRGRPITKMKPRKAKRPVGSVCPSAGPTGAQGGPT